MALDTIGSIAGHIARSFVLPAGISGNLVEIVDIARIEAQNFTGYSIGADSIDEKFQGAITNLAKAQAIEESFAWASTLGVSGGALVAGGISGGQDVKLADLEVSESGRSQEAEALDALSQLSKETPKQIRELAINSLKTIGRNVQFVRSLS
jgi:hypothetical protein